MSSSDGKSTSGSTSRSNTNLDLSMYDNTQVDQLASNIEAFYKSDSTTKSQLSWHWERNMLFLDGRQWIIFDGERETGGIWKRLRVSKQNEYIPRPVTNFMYDIYQTLKSYVIKNKPHTSVYPNTQTSRDKNAAKLGTLICETNYERLKEGMNYEYAAAALITYGTVFKKDYWDTSSVSLVKVPRTQVVPKTDPMTGQVVGMEETPVVDEVGNPVFDDMPLGDLNTYVVEPYRLALDPLAMNMHEARWIIEYSIQPLSWIKETYGKEGDGFTGKVEDVKEEANLSGSMRRFFQLKTSSGVRSNSGVSSEGITTSDQMIPNAAVVKEYYERPSQQYPKGRLVVVANGVTLYAGDSPYSGPEQGDWHPYSECRWEIVPGRFWGKGPLDDAVEIQKHINSIDAVIILTRKTMAIPQKMIPIGSGISPGSWTGRPGQEIFYRETGGAVPTSIPGVGVDQSIFQEREQRVNDLKAVTGAIDILKGDRPPGVTAASALNMLFEVGTGKLYPALDRWKGFVESSQKKQLKIIAKFYKEPREDFVRVLKSKNRELSEQAINQFIGSDLYDNCNVIVEAGSNIPKLQAAKQGLLLEIAQTGALALDQPVNRIEFLQQLGITGFDTDVGPDTKRAEWENDLLDDSLGNPDNQPVVLDCDNHDIHIAVHENREKQPSYMALPLEVQQGYIRHIQRHEQMKAQKEQAQMMQQMAMGMPPQPPGPDQSTQPQHHPQSGKGVSKDIKDSIFSDAIKKPGQM